MQSAITASTGVEPERIELASQPRWLTLALAEIGNHEVAGDQDNPAILGYYRDAGHPEIHHDEVAWCAAFVCAMLQRAGQASPRTLSARDFMRWGKPLDRPRPGCIAVFSRGNPRSYTGHVGFWLGEDSGAIKLLGGNQSNAVSIASVLKTRLLGYRWPVTAGTSVTTKSAVAGTIGAVATAGGGLAQVVAQSPDQVVAIGGELKTSGVPWLMVAGSVLTMLALAAVIMAHRADLNKNGK
jgi:uncharacterized protein (TIGR02594 family)